MVPPPPCFDVALGTAGDKNQWALRHSSRTLPLKDSMKGLSVGLAVEPVL